MVNEDIKPHDMWTEGASAALGVITVLSSKTVQVFSYRIPADVSPSSV